MRRLHLDPIIAAEKAEEASAAEGLRRAESKDELISVWWRDCDNFAEGSSARERLQEVYAEALVKFVPAGRAG